ncbi:uncharacterized protein HKW66_Vig0200360 [Vigna angularis]|uniref:Uncharacterized protein n=1 Tax=Phaseolus angularis TaxID=3914 RepID=A0A8T0JRD9_PHAAN|nr:uncharacterized protein HKW66_Vig0200360 [Vigna angularis]
MLNCLLDLLDADLSNTHSSGVIGLIPLLEFGGDFRGEGLIVVDVGATNGGFEAIGLGLEAGVDAGLESVKEKKGTFEEGEGERG